MGNRAGNARRRVAGAVMDALERRALLALAVEGTTLKITGTEEADSIVIAANKRFINFLTAGCNEDMIHVALTAITRIEISALGGNDRVLIDSTLDPLGYAAWVDGGAGHDRIYTSSGNDTVIGGEGNDKIYTQLGNDSIDAGSGRDLIVAGSGTNLVIGGAHSDNITTGSDRDTVYPGSGNDLVDTGGDNDLISDPAGRDTVLAGEGNDTGKLGGGGIVNAGPGNDTFVATGGAQLHGLDGDDNLQGAFLFGGAGSDTLVGLARNDEIHGAAGDDLIRGYSGSDTLFGDDGNDAIFGGSDTDTLYGGNGDDNLYGTDGHLDKHPELAGRDDGFGEDGVDWFETGYKWNEIDRRDVKDRAVGVQNLLPQDPSYGYYGSAGSSMFIGNAGFDIVTTRINSKFSQIETVSIGSVGWISTGAFDQAQAKFVPPPMSRAQRLSARTAILQVPKEWNIAEMHHAADGIVWYSVWRDAVTINDDGSADVVRAGEPTPRHYPADALHTVAELQGGTASVPTNTPALFDGVKEGRYRFLGVRKGTVLISAVTTVAEPTQYAFDTAVLPIQLNADIRITGEDRIFRQQSVLDTLPTGGPKSLDGILVEGGAIWLPTDGSGAYFSSGKN